MEQKETYTLDEVLSKVKFTNPNFKNNRITDREIFDGDSIKMCSFRLQTFATKGIKCAKCGIEGKFFRKEKSDKNNNVWHLNLYAINENNEEILMTKDHIIPKSRGGKDYIENFQTMCTKCNFEKSNKEE
jgi:5-methylcytosine-specific restriction endonuclease McrA